MNTIETAKPFDKLSKNTGKEIHKRLGIVLNNQAL